EKRGVQSSAPFFFGPGVSVATVEGSNLMRYRCLLVIVLAWCSGVLRAQTISATTYPFTNSTGATLEDMSAGTAQLLLAGLDDNASAVTDIGFDFWFTGARYTQFSVNANGLMKLGIIGATTEFTNTMSSTGNLPKITA